MIQQSATLISFCQGGDYCTRPRGYDGQVLLERGQTAHGERDEH
jgi:hypothetical protein